MMLRRIAFTALLGTALARPAAAQGKLKVYISADMEGIAGVVTGDQLGPQGFEYERFRGFMTYEVLAATRAPGPPARRIFSSPTRTATARTS